MQKFSRAQESLGTRIEIQVWSAQEEKAFSAMDKAFFEAKRIEKKFSRFRQDNLLTKIRQNPHVNITLDKESYDLFHFAQELQTLSGGLFHIGIAPVIEHHGYDASYTLRPSKDKTPDISKWTLSSSEPYWIQSSGPLDLGGLGKGYALDQMLPFFDDFDNVLINAGGDIICKGIDLDKGAWLIGLENPFDPESVLGVLELKNEAFAASSGEKRRWHPEYHHIISPFTKTSTHPHIASFVRAPKAIIADSLATLFYIQEKTPSAAIAEKFGAEFAIIEKDLHIDASPKFQIEWF